MSTLDNTIPYPPLSTGFAHGYIVTMRPYLLFVSGITGIAGMAYAGSVAPTTVAIIAAGSFLAYGFGQALTDCTQTDTDALSAPYRPLVRGEIRKRDVAAVSLAGLVAIALSFAALNPLSVAPALIGVAGLATYTWFKRRWWGGPFYNALIVVMLALLAYFAADGAATTGPLVGILPLLAMVLFGYANFVLAGYFKDISADRATGYRTFPVVFGMRAAALVSDLFALAAVVFAATIVYDAHGAALNAGCAFLIAGAIAAAVAQVRLHRTRSERDAHRAIGPVVHAYLLLLSAAAVTRHPEWSVPLVLFYCAWCAVLARRPMKQQI